MITNDKKVLIVNIPNASVLKSKKKNVILNILMYYFAGEEKNKYGKQRLWGSVGWSLAAVISGISVDWYSKDLTHKNYTPAFIISLLCFLINVLVIFKIKASKNHLFNYTAIILYMYCALVALF